MSIFVKICGITNEKDAYSAIKYGADAIGLNQFTKSPRYVDESELFKRTERPRPKADFFLDLLIICFF